jgi:hypothetical protein
MMKLFIRATNSRTDHGSSNSWTIKPVNNFYEKALSKTENFSCGIKSVKSVVKTLPSTFASAHHEHESPHTGVRILSFLPLALELAPAP